MKTVLKAISFAAGLAAATLPASAQWRAVGPGISVVDARQGSAALAVECLNGIVLGIYNIVWGFEHAEPLDMTIGDETFAVAQYGSGDRIVLADAFNDREQLHTTAALRDALKAGQSARLSGPAVKGIDPAWLTFTLSGSERAIASVEENCKQD